MGNITDECRASARNSHFGAIISLPRAAAGLFLMSEAPASSALRVRGINKNVPEVSRGG